MENMIRKEIEIKAPVSRVWAAISDSKQFGEWFKVSLEGPFVAGKKIYGKLRIPKYEHLTFEFQVHKIEPENLFSYYWHPYAVEENVDYSKETPTLVEFRLEAIPGGTKLIVTETGFDKIPKSRQALALRMNTEGWTIQVQNVKNYVEKK